MEIKEIPLSLIEADEAMNCRGPVTLPSVMDLAGNIKQYGGLVHPVTVCDRRAYYEKVGQKFYGKQEYYLVAGFRRFKAHSYLDWPTIMANCIEIKEVYEVQLINLQENIQKLELNMLQEAHGVYRMLERGIGPDYIAVKLNRPKGWVDARIALIEMKDQKIWDAAQSGQLNQTHIKKLAKMKDTDARDALLRKFREAKGGKEVKKTEVKDLSGVKASDQKKKRGAHEISQMRDFLYEIAGPNFGTRVLAWVEGTITDKDIYDSIHEAVPEWTPPEECVADIFARRANEGAGRGGSSFTR